MRVIDARRVAFAVLLVGLIPLGSCWAAGNRSLQQRELEGWCAAFAGAERKFPKNPKAAYDDVHEHHVVLWPDLMKTVAGIRGVTPGTRYPLALRFAQVDFGFQGWECPAMDRVLLGVAENGIEPPDSTTYPLIHVTQEGKVTVFGKPVRLDELETKLREVLQDTRIVDLYREGWRTRPHANAKRVLDLVVTMRFVIGLKPRPP